jgi:Zn finger protein HypA/HybF involved in hydrogenase expression
MAKKSKEIKESLSEEATIEIKQVNPLTISECCNVDYISSGTKVYCSKCKADCRLERQKKLIKLWSPKA